MNELKLSNPLVLQGDSVIEKINNSFKIFNSVFGLRQFRPNFNGKFIFFNTNKLYQGQQLMYPERFMHIISIEDKPTYTIFPCNNDVTYSLCQNKCSPSVAQAEFQKISRNECFYRLARVHWIPEIINLANSEDSNIKIWIKEEKDHKGKLIKKNYIRYDVGFVDYIIILKEDIKRGTIYKYDFVTSFPVFTKRNKDQFEKDYNKFLQNKKSAAESTP